MPHAFWFKSLKWVLLMACSQVVAKEVKIHVIDDLGAPVAGAKSSIFFVNSRNDERRDGLTDIAGVYSASGSSTNSFGFTVSKDGHYPARVEGLTRDKDHDVKVVLSRIVKPIPLYSWRGDGSEAVGFPVHNEWLGFDFEAADWVAPYGKGKTTDILLRFRNEFKGWEDGLARDIEALMAETKELAKLRKKEWTMEWFKMVNGKWDGVMDVSFPNEGDGMFEEKRFLEYSRLKMPHEAPMDGYATTWRYEACNYHYRPVREKVGFFLRTRVKRDQQGSVVSANYTKLIGDLNVNAATGRVEMFYYFNPVPNDRNLEFDPKENLFPKDKPGANVYDP